MRTRRGPPDEPRTKIKQTQLAAKWQGLVAEHESSGITLRAFCQERGIKYHTFAWWRRRLQRERSAGFVEVRLPELQAEYGVRLGSGRELVIRGSFQLERVAQLMKLLEGDDV